VLVTHDVAEAAYFADRIVLLRDGAVLQEGAPQDLIEHPLDSYVARFIRAQRAPIGGIGA
jgi:osmoprotectant transport system ATP-binding protein